MHYDFEGPTVTPDGGVPVWVYIVPIVAALLVFAILIFFLYMVSLTQQYILYSCNIHTCCMPYVLYCYGLTLELLLILNHIVHMHVYTHVSEIPRYLRVGSVQSQFNVDCSIVMVAYIILQKQLIFNEQMCIILCMYVCTVCTVQCTYTLLFLNLFG